MKHFLEWLRSNWSSTLGVTMLMVALLVLLTACSSPKVVVNEQKAPPKELLQPVKPAADSCLSEVQLWLDDVLKYLETP